MKATVNRLNHPCFNADVKGSCGRVHLPVAPKCNIKCNYCNRKYDCVNESRPGVSSAVLTPEQAVNYLSGVLEKLPQTTVAGIAGPGDAFAEPERTMNTLRLVRERFPHIILCLATNGLNVLDYVDELARLDVSHVTVTVNAVDPEIGARVYAWARPGKVIYRKEQAARLLLARQLQAITALKARGIVVKVNTIVIPGINDSHVGEVSKQMAELGVDIQNCMPMFPNDDAPFGAIPEPSKEMMAGIRADAEDLLPQMLHCTRCRADAVGLLDDDRSADLHGCLSTCSQHRASGTDSRPYVAVATLEGALVNQHLGEASRFRIWEQTPDGFRPVEEREAPEPGGGDRRWHALAETLQDCRAVLVSGIGERPRTILSEQSIIPVEMNGFIERGLEAVFNGGDLSALKGRRPATGCSGGCSGSGAGCG